MKSTDKALIEPAITTSTKVELGFFGGVVAVVVYALSHLLPMETKVEGHEKQIGALSLKVDRILEDTQYIKGQLSKGKK